MSCNLSTPYALYDCDLITVELCVYRVMFYWNAIYELQA